MGDVIAEIAVERKRQISEEKWTPEHDDRHRKGEIAQAAATYALLHTSFRWTRNKIFAEIWPWELEWLKPKSDRRNLIRSAALLVAEIERLDRVIPNKISKAVSDAQKDIAQQENPDG